MIRIMNPKPYNPIDLISPPGDTLRETIECWGMTQAELAERMGRPRATINDLIQGREPLSLRTAFQLEKVTGISVDFWLQRELSYRRALLEAEHRAARTTHRSWLRRFPLAEMKQYGWLPATDDPSALTDALLNFFALAAPERWSEVYLNPAGSATFRSTLEGARNPHALSAWLRAGERLSHSIETADFRKSSFRAGLDSLCADGPSADGFMKDRLQTRCAELGLCLVYVPPLGNASVIGAARWYRGRPLLQLLLTDGDDPELWSTFFHLAGHLLLHGKKNVFLEGPGRPPQDPVKESEATAFAARYTSRFSESRVAED